MSTIENTIGSINRQQSYGMMVTPTNNHKTTAMPFDLTSTKVTWAALCTVAALIFSSGSAWYSIQATAAETTKQWTHINRNSLAIEHQGLYTSQIDSIAKSLQDSQKFNETLNLTIVRLTSAVENWDSRSVRDEHEKEKAAAFMMQLSKQVNSIEVTVGAIQARLEK